MIGQFTNIEFKGMMFNPAKVPDGDSIFKVYPDLKKYPIFKKSPGVGLDNDLVMLYIMCMYDKSTPYRGKFEDILKRKMEVAHDIGFPLDETGTFAEPVEEMMKGKNPLINMKIVEFVRLHRSFKYTFLVTIESSYYNVMLEVLDGSTKRIADLKGIQEELEETMIQILHDDDNPYLRDAVLRYMEEDRLHLRPEDVAVRLLKEKK
ncbi:MAG: hypothetical protein IMZ64_07385 [Bacteroidetes bacterium]|nr:hypothetical protein [Bacteroidota bacterium]